MSTLLASSCIVVVLNLVLVEMILDARLGRVAKTAPTSLAHEGNVGLRTDGSCGTIAGDTVWAGDPVD